MGLNNLERNIPHFEAALLQFVAERKGAKCDKCGELVDPTNNLAVFNFVKLSGDPMQTVWSVDRHLLPVTGEGGVVLCEGSPSNSQHLRGGMMEEREEYRKDDPELAAQMQAFYDLMQVVLTKGKSALEPQPEV